MGIVPLLVYLFVFVDLNLQWFESCYEWFVLCRLVAHNFNRKKTKVLGLGLGSENQRRKKKICRCCQGDHGVFINSDLIELKTLRFVFGTDY